MRRIIEMSVHRECFHLFSCNYCFYFSPGSLPLLCQGPFFPPEYPSFPGYIPLLLRPANTLFSRILLYWPTLLPPYQLVNAPCNVTNHSFAFVVYLFSGENDQAECSIRQIQKLFRKISILEVQEALQAPT